MDCLFAVGVLELVFLDFGYGKVLGTIVTVSISIISGSSLVAGLHVFVASKKNI